MNGNVELLNYVYQNSQMGLDTINQLEDMAKDDKFKMQLESELKEYRSINEEAKGKLHQHGCEEKDIGTMAKINTYLSLNMQTLTDKTSSHMAEMLIVGSTMGIIQATRNMKKYKDAEASAVNITSRLLKFEQNNVETLKNFL